MRWVTHGGLLRVHRTLLGPLGTDRCSTHLGRFQGTLGRTQWAVWNAWGFVNLAGYEMDAARTLAAGNSFGGSLFGAGMGRVLYVPG